MNGKIIKFEGRPHREVELLLPWFVNGTLDRDEQAMLERHLEECDECRREIAELRDLHAVCLQESEISHDATPAWRRMRERLPTASEDARARPPWWRAIFGDWRQTTPWLRYAVVAQSAVLLCVIAFSIPRDPPAGYRLLGAAPAAPTASNTLVVLFDPQATEAQMRQLLRASQTRIVDGPSDAGVYVLAVPSARLATVRAALRASPAVTLVESLAPEEGR